MKRIYTFGLTLAALAGLGIAHAGIVSANKAASASKSTRAEVKTLDYIAIKPADGAIVKSLNEITVTFPGFEDTQMEMDEKLIQNLTVTLGDQVVANADIETFEGNIDWMTENQTITFNLTETLTTPGTYTINFPEGCFIEKGYQWGQGFVPVEDGYISAAFSSTVIIDANAKGGLDLYELNPESGTVLDEIEFIMLSFPELSLMDMSWESEPGQGTFSNGKEEIPAYLVPNQWSSGLSFMVAPAFYDQEWDEMAPGIISTPGKWTLTIPAGAVVLANGDTTTEEIVAEYIIPGDNTPYTLSPEPESTVNNLGSIEITFPDAEKVEYNDIAITLAGPEDAVSSTREVHGSANAWTISFRNPSVEGKYTLKIPEGAFSVDGEDSPEIEAVYNFVTGWTLDPAPNSTIETVEFTLSFPTATKVEYVGAAYNFIVRAGAYNGLPGMVCTEIEGADVPSFKLTAPEEADKLPNGMISLMIEEGTFIIDGKDSGEILANYTLEAPVSTDFTVSPEGTVVLHDYGFDIAFLFDESATISVPSKTDITVTINDKQLASSSYEMMTEQNMLMFGFYDPSVLEPGALKIAIKEGAFKIGNTPNLAIEVEWEIVGEKTFEAIVTPLGETDGNKTNSLEQIAVEFPTATSAEVFNEYGAYLKGPKYYYCTGKIEIEESTRSEGVKVIVSFEDEMTEDGEYTFTMRTGTLTLDSNFESPEIEEIYILDSSYSGVGSSIADENGNFTVITLDGKVILDNAPASALRDLNKGLYIINGKKALLK